MSEYISVDGSVGPISWHAWPPPTRLPSICIVPCSTEDPIDLVKVAALVASLLVDILLVQANLSPSWVPTKAALVHWGVREAW